MPGDLLLPCDLLGERCVEGRSVGDGGCGGGLVQLVHGRPRPLVGHSSLAHDRPDEKQVDRTGHANRRSTPTGTRLMTKPRGAQGQAGTTADFFSFSIASTIDLTPREVEATSGVFADVPDISETM